MLNSAAVVTVTLGYISLGKFTRARTLRAYWPHLREKSHGTVI
jgi:hypothetical protein